MPKLLYRVATTEDDFAGVRQAMAEIFVETSGQKANEFGEALWRWQYLDIASGSIVVMAIDEEAGKVCGYYHVLLFPVRHRERQLLGAVVQDVGTLRDYRKHGIFRQLGAYALEQMRAARVSFIYTFPNNLSLPSFVRNHGYTIVAQAPVYLTPLRIGPLLSQRLKLGPLGGLLGAVADPLHRGLWARRESLHASESIQTVERFSDSLLPLAQHFASQTGIGMVSTVDYLNWRFFAKPTVQYKVWSLMRNGEPQAYTVTRHATMFDTECVLFMTFGFRPGQADGLRRLLSARLEAERKDGVAMAVSMGLHPAFAELGQLGFLKVPERFNPRTFNLLVKDLEEPAHADLFDGGNWMITLADWDVF